MNRDKFDLLVVGSGLCGLTIAITAAQRGLTVRCVSNGQPGASLANFGQLHSGAVYAPVLPDVAQACWSHRDRWHELASQARISSPYGYGLFSTSEAVSAYQQAWQAAGIDVEEVDPADSDLSAAYPPPAAAFRLPDFSVDLLSLHQLTSTLALASGVLPAMHGQAAIRRDSASALVSLNGHVLRTDMIVLATGAETVALLEGTGITHTLRTRQIPWGELTEGTPEHLTYWLDGDLLAMSPTRDGVRVGLPGVRGSYGNTGVEAERLRASLAHHRISHTDDRLWVRWGTVCEPAADHADPSSFIADLRKPPQGWTRAENLMIALPGKWTTAWHCADRVIDALL